MHPCSSVLAASDREMLLLMAQRIETLHRAVEAITTAQERYVADITNLQERLDQLWLQTRYLVAALLFVVTPMYGAAVWALVAHVVGTAK